jgi:hypothetical protein
MAGEKKCKVYIRKRTLNETEAACASYVYNGCNDTKYLFDTKNLFDTKESCQPACPSPVAP